MALRFFIGIIGCVFVSTQFWTSIMFSSEIVGTANAYVGGWGNLGGGLAFLLMPSLFEFITINGTVSYAAGWRLTMIFPAVLLILTGVIILRYSDDCPTGNYEEFRNGKKGKTYSIDPKESFYAGLKNYNTWILAIHYACCFGVEIQVNNILGLYFYEDFLKDNCNIETDADECRVLSQTTSGIIASVFGLTNLFARAAGGILSDWANSKTSMRGRLFVHLIIFILAGIFLFLFSHVKSLEWSIFLLLLFSIKNQAAEGSTFAIVPFVNVKYTGAIAGFVGAGGSLGGMIWGFLFKLVDIRRDAFMYMSIIVFCSSALTLLINIDEYSTIFTTESTKKKRLVTDHDDEQSSN